MVPWPIAMHDTWMCVQVDRRRRDCRNGRSVWPPCSWGNHDGAWVHGACEFMGREFISSWGVSSWGNHGRREFMVRGFMRQSWWCVSSWCVSSWGNHGRREFMVREFMRQSWWCVGSRNCSPISEHCSCVSAGKCSWSCDEDFCVETTEIVHEAIMAGVVSGSGSWFWGCDQDLCIKVKLKEWRGFLYHYQIEGVTRIFVSKSKSLKSCTRQSWQCTDSGRSSLYDSYKCKYSPCGNISVMQAWWCIFPWELLCYCTYLFLSFVWRAQNETSQPFIVIQVASTKSTKPQHSDSSLCTELARTVYIISPCIWWFSYQKDRWYTVYVYMVLANPTRVLGYKCPFS